MIFFSWTAGGTFALYSLICRHANVSLLPNKQVVDEELSTYILECPTETKNGSRVKTWLEKHKNLHTALLAVVMLGTCMVIGDGVLTPAISGNFPLKFSNLFLIIPHGWQIKQCSPCICIFCAVFSAVSGLELSMSKDHRECKHSCLNSAFIHLCLLVS